MLLFRLSGSLLLRFADRQFLPLLIQLPPRSTRAEALAVPRHLLYGAAAATPALHAHGPRERHQGLAAPAPAELASAEQLILHYPVRPTQTAPAELASAERMTPQ